MLLYAAYFFIGAGIGAANFERGVLSADGRLAKSSWGWVDRDARSLLPAVGADRHQARDPGQSRRCSRTGTRRATALFFAAFSAAILFAILAYFLRFKRSGWSMLDPMQPDAYGMFLVHYPIVLWLQYWLFDFDLPAIVKAAVAFVADRRIELGATARCANSGATRAVTQFDAPDREARGCVLGRQAAVHIGRQPALEAAS